MKSARKSSIDEATLINIENDSEKANKNQKSAEAYPLLEIQSGPKQGSWFTLSQQKEITIGRASVNTIVLEDNSVSRSHTVIHEEAGKFYIKDVGSRNGTYVNDQRVQENYLLKHSDKVRIGIYNLVFLTEAEDINLLDDDFFEDEPAAPTLIKEIEPDNNNAHSNDLSSSQSENSELINEVKANSEVSIAEQPLLPEDDAQVSNLSTTAPASENVEIKTVVFALSILLLLAGVAFTAYRMNVKKNAVQSVEFTPPTAVEEPTVAPQVTNQDSNLQVPETNPVVINNGAPTDSPDHVYVLPTNAQAPESQPVANGSVESVNTALTSPSQATAVATAGTPVFLDIDSKPLPAKIIYQGKELGVTPFKVNVNVPLGSPQELIAVYSFPELGQAFSEKKTFSVSKQDEIVNVRFEGVVGTMQIKSLPRETSVYLEATFASNQLKTQTVKLQEIVYTRPIYLPYGNYKLEVKKPSRVEASSTVVDVVKYHRDFVIDAQNPNYNLSLNEADLLQFPAMISSNPPGAEIWVDNKKYGLTSDKPTEFLLPFGKGSIVLKKDGYNDYEYPVAITMNTPVALDISLKTSEAGVYVNKGKDLIKQGQYAQAVDQLGEALKHNPLPNEVSEIQYYLGLSYIQTKAFDIALGYLEKSRLNPLLKTRSDLAIAEAYFSSGRSGQAMNVIVDVMLNEKDIKLKSDAETLFHKISGLKSVILVSTEPAGAKVLVNNQEIGQASPVLLSDIALGGYHLVVEKAGYKKYETRFELTVSSFKPLLIKLEPLP